MHTVCATPAFERTAAQVGMSEDEITALISFLSENPDAGDVIRGTDGCRKVRWAGRGKGKSGGYRTITFFAGESLPVYLLAVYSKGAQENLTKGERNELKVVVGRILRNRQVKTKVVKLRRRS